MKPLYEKPMWTADAEHYASTSNTFAVLALILGGIGTLGAIIMCILAIPQIGSGGLSQMIAAIALGFQSIMLIVFGSMMQLLSKVLLSVFEISLFDVRQRVHDSESDATNEAD